jgi:hypothetical protein
MNYYMNRLAAPNRSQRSALGADCSSANHVTNGARIGRIDREQRLVSSPRARGVQGSIHLNPGRPPLGRSRRDRVATARSDLGLLSARRSPGA